MNVLRIIPDIVFVVFSVFLLLYGLFTFFRTSGNVWGSQFGAMILIGQELSLGLIWLALYGICKWVKKICSLCCELGFSKPDENDSHEETAVTQHKAAPTVKGTRKKTQSSDSEKQSKKDR